MNVWLVVACPGSRADELTRCLGSLQHPPERTVIVSSAHHDPHPAARILDDSPDFSLGRLWNLGLRWAYNLLDPVRPISPLATHVAVLASDTTGHPGSLPTLADAMATHGWTMAGPTLDGTPTRQLDGTRTVHDRIQGAAFMLDARHQLFCDETYRWWYTEDDLEMQARQHGPVGVVAGTGLALSQPDSTLTEERQAWAVEGRRRFVEKWGCDPW